MSENIPPNAHTANSDATRGIPYYEKLKRDLREIIQKKRLLDKNMAALEEQIYRLEGSYIKGSSAAGATAGTVSGGTSIRRKGTV